VRLFKIKKKSGSIEHYLKNHHKKCDSFLKKQDDYKSCFS
jgi:hypothetical protein